MEIHASYSAAMGRYRADEHLPYFCTVTILDWLPVLIDRRYIEPIIESLRHCRVHKQLRLFAFVIMPNHLHLIAGAEDSLHDVMRDFKRFTSRTIHDRLREDGRSTMLRWLGDATDPARRARGELGFWRPGFHPKAIQSRSMFDQKARYLHENPARKGLVARPEDWWYSSAAQEAGRAEVCLEVDPFDP